MAIWVDGGSIGESSSRHGGIFALPSFVVLSNTGTQMHLTPRELDKLMIHMLSDVALKRKGKGLKLNHPESVAVLCAYVLDGAREGKSVEEVMDGARSVLSSDDVMEGVIDLVPLIQVEAVFTDGSRLVSLHNPIT